MTEMLKIYGERNTNINYLSSLIELNLDIKQLPSVVPYRALKLQESLPGNEWLKDLYFYLTYRTNLGWKHSRIPPISKLLKNQILKYNLSFITLTKNPYSWLLSLYRQPYHQYYTEKPNFTTFLTTPWKTVNRENCPAVIENPIELWNIKNNSYLTLSEFKCLNFSSESLFINPESIIDTISNTFDIKKNPLSL